MRVLVTRPEPGASATAARLRELGHGVTVAPLLATAARDWTLPEPLPPAVLLTSAAGARLAGPQLAALRALPCHAVGDATAAAARAAGFSEVHTGAGTVQALLDALASTGVTEILHLAGAERTPVVLPVGLSIVTRIVYGTVPLPLPAPPHADWVLLYSPRSAARFAAECDRLAVARATLRLAALSPAVAAAAGGGWGAVVVAAAPHEDALLAALALPCEERS
ncbi:hypothetical protein IP88_11400 [alpha proteobacterium AAP81b]|nr:hypothetical protein IP88_11400 [alpha proteobacterium AAP81b]